MNEVLAGKVAVVTGASRGIGLAVAAALSEHGAAVVAGARNPDAALRTATLQVLAVDLSTPQGPARLVDYAQSALGRIDLLVNNVGGSPAPFDGFLAVDDHAWQATLDVTFLSAVRATRAALPSLLDHQGAIINIGSVNARLPTPNLVAYSAAKAALATLSKALAEEFGPQGLRVNTISPGPVLTDVWTAPGSTGAAIAEQMNIPLAEFTDHIPTLMGLSTRKLTHPAEIAALVVFLASPAARNINGSDLIIDGGMLKTT